MNRTLFFALCSAALAVALPSVAEEPAPDPVGYIIELDPEGDMEADNEDKALEPKAFCVHNGERLPASEGLEVYAGDTIVTEKDGLIAVAFVDSSALTLRASSTVKIDDYAYPARKAPTHVTVEQGRAFFDIKPRPDDAHFFVRTKMGEVEVRGTKFEVWSAPYGAGFKTTIAVKKGTVTVTPTGSKSVQVNDGTQLILNITNLNIAGWSPDAMELNKGNISKDMMKVLDASALCDVEVNVSKKKLVRIKSWNKNPDGSKTYIRMTEIAGSQIRMVTIVKNAAGKAIARIRDYKGRSSSQAVEGNLSIKQRLSDGAGIGVIRDNATRKYYRGSVVTLDDGTVVTDCKARDGSRIVYSKQRLSNGTIITIKTTFDPGATQGTQFTEVKRRDGFRRTWFETVSTTQLPNGDFVSQSGVVNMATFPRLPPGAPEILSTTAIVVPDTTTPEDWELQIVEEVEPSP